MFSAYTVESIQLMEFFLHWHTAIYALNQLDSRKGLWAGIVELSRTTLCPWILVGDYNNVLKAQDRIGGSLVHLNEYSDLDEKMDLVGLSEANSTCDYHCGSYIFPN